MTKEKDPNEGLASDATLATDLGDEDKRRDEQQVYYGGDPIEDDDKEDLSTLDRGDAIADDNDGEDDDVDADADESKKTPDGEKEDDSEDEDGESDDDSDDESSDGEDSDDDDSEDSEGDAEGDDDSESEDSDDDDSDGEDEDEDEDVDPEPKGIPRHRFNEVNTRMKNAEAEIRRRDAETTATKDAKEDKFDFDSAEDEYMALLLDGKTREAGDKRREIRLAEKEDFKADTKAETTAEINHTATQRAVDSLTKEAELMFPVFNEKSDDFNPAAVSKTLTIMRGYQTDGMVADDAFVAALADVIEIFGLAESQSDEESSDEDKGDEVVKKKGKVVTKKGSKKDTKKAIKAAKQQGKSVVGEGERSADRGAVVPDIADLTDDELDALPPETLARLRGDYI